MRGLLATMQRELRAYYLSPLGWAVLTFVLVVNGGVFWVLVSILSDPRSPGSATPLEYFFGQTIFFWLVLLFVAPVLTMRLVAEERKSGTIEVLMTAPISEGQVVTAKYLAALLFYVALWLPSLAYAAILAAYSEVDWGPVAAGYLGILGIGAVFLAVGMFASSLARNQIVAALATFAMLMVLFSFGLLEGLFQGEVLKEAFGYMNLWQHMEDFSKGIVDTRRLVFYVSVTVLFLFLASRSLEAKKWR
jgi:ABC-2 type transport system permease protein